jgi:uncharacterized protein (TIGR02145 family)
MKKPKIISICIILFAIALTLVTECKRDTNSSANKINGKTDAVFNTNLIYGTMTDQDGNTYKTIQIGTQTWMAENLRTTKYVNGDSISIITDEDIWGFLDIGVCCNYNNTSNVDTIATHGRFYNWYAVNDSRRIAPIGWHVPTNADWSVLTNYLGGDTAAGSLKEAGTIHWLAPNKGGTNFSGFTALPGGGFSQNYHYQRNSGYWWINEVDQQGNPASVFLLANSNEWYSGWDDKNAANSVRLIKDN